jgi:hypothetical protein
MSAEDAHRDACWVLNIVGGLALTKALEEALPALNFSEWSNSNLILLLRLFIFLRDFHPPLYRRKYFLSTSSP